jgi:FkbM family methyltransferase
MEPSPPWGHFKPHHALNFFLNLTNALPRNYAGRRLLFIFRKILRIILGNKTLDVVRLGAKLRIQMAGNVCEGRILFNEDYFDAEERKFLRDHLTSNSIFIDAGANIGGYSFDISSTHPNATILAIEAHPETFARLKLNIANNPQMKIEAIHCALSTENGEAILFVNHTNAGENSTRISNIGGTSMTVKARSLLDILKEHRIDKIDALKIDIEGAEDDVLAAFFAKAHTTQFPTYILIENLGDRWNFDLIGFLKQSGYEVVRDFGNNLALKRGTAQQ